MTKFLCSYCGKTHNSPNGTGSDVSCCGEIGHCEELPEISPRLMLAVKIQAGIKPEKEKS